MPAAITDKFADTYNAANPNVARVTSTRSAAGTSLSCDNLSGWPTGTVVHFSTYRLNTSNAVVAGTQIDWVGIVSGSTIGSLTRITGATDNGSAVGDVVEMNPTAKWASNLVNGILVGHNQDGTHATNSITTANITDSNVTTAKIADGAVTNAKLESNLASGWIASSSSVSSVTYNGNRSYTIVTGTDISTLVSPGMRIRTTRTVAAPTQVASLNGTNNYFSKTSPAGMTFTDDFVVSAWVKVSAYQSSHIISRYNGTNGWALFMDATGQIGIVGFNGGSGNYKGVRSYQSLPLNKWVHITSQVDMNTATNTSTTNYVMIDGVDVPAAIFQGGTNPTALVQAGNLEIGGSNGGLQPFSGKIAQAAVFNAKVTQATIRGYISQGLSGSETSLISAYSFNNSITDLNTSNANNLTNNNSTSITNADSPFGGQANGTISATLDYGIVQSISGTSIVVQVPEGCTIPTSGGVSAIAYSVQKSPYGFPGQVAKWTVEMTNKTNASQSSASEAVWYNLGSQQLNIPIGEWNVGTKVSAQNNSAAGNRALLVTLSTGSSTETDKRFTMYSETNGSITAFTLQSNCKDSLSLSAATVYYLNTSALAVSTTSIYNRGDYSPTKIFAENAYL